MKIFHCADIHLDSPMSLIDTKKAKERREMMLDEFVSMMRYAKSENVDMVLIAGDLFDCQYCQKETKSAVISAFELLDCPIVITTGNHDPYYKGSFYADAELPKNVYVFNSEKISYFDFDELNIRVHGYAFTKHTYDYNPLDNKVEMARGKINILLAHSDVKNKKQGVAPLSPTELGTYGFNYVALGHIHNQREPFKVGKTLMAYSGCAMGRSFDELGLGGGLVVNIDDDNGEISLTRIIFAKLHFEIETLDVSGLSSDKEVAEKIKALCTEKQYDKNTALRVILVGGVENEYTPSSKKIISEPAIPLLETLEIKDKTFMSFDYAKLKEDTGIKGEFFRTLLPSLNSNDSEVAERAKNALKMGLLALDLREIGIFSED